MQDDHSPDSPLPRTLPSMTNYQHFCGLCWASHSAPSFQPQPLTGRGNFESNSTKVTSLVTTTSISVDGIKVQGRFLNLKPSIFSQGLLLFPPSFAEGVGASKAEQPLFVLLLQTNKVAS